MASILVVDDAHSLRRALEALLSREGYTVLTAASGDEALAHLEQHEVDVLLCDVSMPTMDGLAVLRHVQAHDAGIAAVMMSGHGDITTAVAAMKEGAYDCLVKPISCEDLLRTVQKALAMRALYIENLVLKRQVYDQFARAHVIGPSPAWQRVCQMVKQIAPSQATVLLTGESGTGKELIAGLLHRLSPRAERPFIVLNAAAIPATLLEAELFGYEKGAFTGALTQRLGRFELANGGTLFLDEIGDLPLDLQPKLLRVLQEHAFERLGSSRTVHVNVRVVAATHRDLLALVHQQQFRADLYYRLHVFPLTVPPLRERREDIPLLVRHFAQQYAHELHKDSVHIPAEAMEALVRYDWPGNVRELQNVIERAVILATNGVLRPIVPEQSPVVCDRAAAVALRSQTLDDAMRAHIVDVLRSTNWVVGGPHGAATRLGVKRTTLAARMEKLGICRPQMAMA